MFASFIALLAAALPNEEIALERYRQAESAKETALLDLEQCYTEMELALHDWRAVEDRHDQPLAEALHDVLQELPNEIADLKPSPNRSDFAASHRSKRQIREFVATRVAELLNQRQLLHPDLVRLSSERISRAVSSSLESDKLPGKIRQSLADLLIDPAPFHDVWNEFLSPRVPASKRYQESYNEYIAAGVELDRVRHPEYYEPGGQKVRPGMVYIPGGTYALGPNTGFERKKQRVSLRPFLIDQYEVTNAEYLTFLEAQTPIDRTTHGPRHWQIGDDGLRHPPADRLDHPIVGITWRDAHAYATWAGKRLPTENEWEVACRGKESFEYPWGHDYQRDHCNASDLGLDDTVSVGRFAHGVSPFQVFQMAGNVEEWTASHEDGHTIKELTSNIAPLVVRGGHFLSPAENVGARFRWVAPAGSTRERYIGFRCASDLE